MTENQKFILWIGIVVVGLFLIFGASYIAQTQYETHNLQEISGSHYYVLFSYLGIIISIIALIATERIIKKTNNKLSAFFYLFLVSLLL